MGVDTGRAADLTQTEHYGERRRVTVSEAADILGTTAEAVRTRIKRGRLDSVKDPPRPGGTVYVLLPPDPTRPNADPTSQGQDQTDDQTPPDTSEELVEELRDRVRYLERQVEEERAARFRADQLLAQLMQRIPELEPPREAPPEPPGGPETATDAVTREEPFTSEESPQEGVQRRGFWARLFGTPGE